MVSIKKILLILGVLFAVQLAVIYAFKIPQGPKGETGPIGPAGPQGPQGPQGILGSVGSATIRGMFDITAYGAKGDGVTDDTQAIQAAIDAAVRAKGTVYIPASPLGDFNYYRITRTLTIVGSPSYPADQIWIAMVGQGHIDKQIVYDGPSNSSALNIIGLKGGYLQNIKVHIADGKTNVTAYEVGTSNYSSSTGGFSFYNCTATLGNGANNKGWRMGYLFGGTQDISNITWDNCIAMGAGRDGAGTGQIGWNIDGPNTLLLTWTGGGGALLHKLVSITRGGALSFFGFGGSQNAYDYYMSWSNNLGIYGGRFEAGKKFLYVEHGDSHPAIKIDNVQLGAYSPPDGYVFQMNSPGTLQMDAVAVNDYMLVGPVVRLGYNGVNVGNFHWTGGYAQSTAAELVSVQSAPNWKVNIKSVGKMNAAFHVPAYFPDR